MHTKILYVLFLICLGSVSSTKAQVASDTSTWNSPPDIELRGVIDFFYAYDFNEPQGPRQRFFFQHNRHNEFQVNLALLQVKVEHPRYRAGLGLHTGTYPEDNYAAETNLSQLIYEAQLGIRLHSSANLWLDAGIFPSHLGFESPIPQDNPTLTRSLVAESSPYYLSGVKVSYTSPNKQWEWMAGVYNGWQRIRRVPGNSLPSFGTQVLFKPSKKLDLNWSTFVGTEDPDSSRRIRQFHNFYAIYRPSQSLSFIMDWDIGWQQTGRKSSSHDTWYGLAFVGRYAWNPRWSGAIRVEHFYDPQEIVVFPQNPLGFRAWAYSLNLDFQPVKYLVWRIEGKYIRDLNPILPEGSLPTFSRDNFTLISSLSFQLGQMLGR